MTQRTQRNKRTFYKGAGPDTTHAPPAGVNVQEDNTLDVIDQLALFRSLQPTIKKALSSNNPNTFLKEIQVAALLGIYDIARCGTTDQARLKAWQDLADRAGLKPPDRQAILNLSTSDLTPAEMTAKIWDLMQEGGDVGETETITQTNRTVTKGKTRRDVTPARRTKKRSSADDD